MKAGKFAAWISLCALCVCVLAACGGNKENASENKPEAVADQADGQETEAKGGADADDGAEKNENGQETYFFVYNDVSIAADMDMEEVKKAIGEPDSCFEQESCAAQGIAKICSYPGFEIETYPDGKRDRIACVVLKDDSVATPEGVDLSMTKKDIIAAYGSDYTESGTALVYEKGGAKLLFIMKGENIASIEYDSPKLS